MNSSDQPKGYASKAYADSLSEFAALVELPRSGGWLLERPIPGAPRSDLTCCYPLLCLSNWDELPTDIESLANGPVSLVAVIDPLARVPEKLLEAAFPDVRRVFKQHMLADLGEPREAFVAKRHQRNTRHALDAMNVEPTSNPKQWASEWQRLYANLIVRHHITGLQAFSERSLELQLDVPGAVAFRATDGVATLGMLVFYVSGNRAYYHLGAHSEDGYKLGSSFALFWEAFAWLAGNGVETVDLGAGAGLVANEDDGLARFKEGWANRRAAALLCGRILDRQAYDQLAKPGSEFFPSYRSPG